MNKIKILESPEFGKVRTTDDMKRKLITILPSIGRLPDGTQKPINEMAAEEREQFRDRLQGIFQREMTDYLRNRVSE